MESGRPGSPTTRVLVETETMLAFVESSRSSPVWRRVNQAEQVLVEVPFCFPAGPEQAGALGISRPTEVELVEGVIDLAILDSTGRWTVIDYKTDGVRGKERERKYEMQLYIYAVGLSEAARVRKGDHRKVKRFRTDNGHA